jgi:hypothetical protein
MKKTKREKQLEKNIDDYLFEDNVRRLFLFDLLRRRKCLKTFES